jgi:hypothetical protein
MIRQMERTPSPASPVTLPGIGLSVGPDWVRTDAFDVEARAGRDVSAERLRRMFKRC